MTYKTQAIASFWLCAIGTLALIAKGDWPWAAFMLVCTVVCRSVMVDAARQAQNEGE